MTATATAPKKQPPILNIANQLTAARLVLGIILFVLIEYELWIASIVIFALAAFSDWLDGYLARVQNLTSTLGRNLDPLVDKVVICGAYIFLMHNPKAFITPWMVVVLVSRELIITSLRSFLENQGAEFGAEWLGKIKMVLQCAALFAIFLALEGSAVKTAEPEAYPDWVFTSLDWLREIMVWGMLTSTALSGLQYLWKAFALLKKNEET
jgi:CDP-diacylglycerol--glycerol-3-phosphate 3-phosphatidyltransferase